MQTSRQHSSGSACDLASLHVTQRDEREEHPCATMPSRKFFFFAPPVRGCRPPVRGLTGSSTNICKGGDGKESRSADKRPKRESQQPRKPMEFQVESYRGGVLRPGFAACVAASPVIHSQKLQQGRGALVPVACTLL